MLRPAAITTAVVFALVLSACSASADIAEEIRPVRTERISAHADGMGATYSGEIRSRREAALGFMVGGRIQRRLVEVGEVVQTGTPLFQLDPTDAALNANASRTQVESARSQFIQYERDYQRYAELGKSHYVSRAEVEKMRLSMETARQSLRAAEANYGVTANQASYTTLRATTSGVITSITAEAGNVVEAGQIVVKIAERGEREIVISVPEARVDELRNAQALAVELWAAPGRRYVGRLRELAPDTDSVTRTYSARVSILDADEKVGLGMTGKLLVALPTNQRLRRVPMTALYDADGTPKVWVVDPKTSRVNTRHVAVAQAQKDGVLISAGLRDGDIVVTAGVNLLHAGQKVRAVEADSAPGARI
jgi:multidrug efflux system membrane fusion protein